MLIKVLNVEGVSPKPIFHHDQVFTDGLSEIFLDEEGILHISFFGRKIDCALARKHIDFVKKVIGSQKFALIVDPGEVTFSSHEARKLLISEDFLHHFSSVAVLDVYSLNQVAFNLLFYFFPPKCSVRIFANKEHALAWLRESLYYKREGDYVKSKVSLLSNLQIYQRHDDLLVVKPKNLQKPKQVGPVFEEVKRFNREKNSPLLLDLRKSTLSIRALLGLRRRIFFEDFAAVAIVAPSFCLTWFLRFFVYQGVFSSKEEAVFYLRDFLKEEKRPLPLQCFEFQQEGMVFVYQVHDAAFIRAHHLELLLEETLRRSFGRTSLVLLDIRGSKKFTSKACRFLASSVSENVFEKLAIVSDSMFRRLYWRHTLFWRSKFKVAFFSDKEHARLWLRKIRKISQRSSFEHSLADSLQDFLAVMTAFSKKDFSKKIRVSQSSTPLYELAEGINHLGTNLEQQEKTLQEQQKKMFQTAKLACLGELSSGFSHELNNPLQLIKGFNERACKQLKNKYPEAYELVKDHLSEVRQNAVRMQKMTERMRDFSRKPKGVSQPFSVNEAIEKTLAMMEEKFRFSSISVVRDLNAQNPHVFGEVNRLEQVLLNLLMNAKDALEEVSDRQIKIVTKIEKDLVRIDVQDNGPGIEEDVMPHIFDAFFTTKEVGKGTGLGLSISQEIVEEQKGKISVSSSAGKGACFSIFFDLCLPSANFECDW